MSPAFEIQLIAIIVSVACAIPGVFLVLRRMSMMSDSITHTILLGIVLAFFIVQDLSSPVLIIGAASMGVITVWFTEVLEKTKLVSEDSAIGVVFPLLFSIAIILITRYAGSVHLDTDSVLLGELAFAPFDRMKINGVDIGAKSIYTAGILLIINIAVISIFYKEVKIAAFDPVLAAVLGFSPILLHYGLMTLVSLTAVGAFEAVGSVLVVAFMIGPPVTANLLTDDLKTMLFLSGGVGALSAVIGYQTASLLDVSIAGCIAVIIGLIFGLTFVFAPQKGLLTMHMKRKKQRSGFTKSALLMHIYNYSKTHALKEEIEIESVKTGLNWENKKLNTIIKLLEKDNSIELYQDKFKITENGINLCKKIEKEYFGIYTD